MIDKAKVGGDNPTKIGYRGSCCGPERVLPARGREFRLGPPKGKSPEISQAKRTADRKNSSGNLFSSFLMTALLLSQISSCSMLGNEQMRLKKISDFTHRQYELILYFSANPISS